MNDQQNAALIGAQHQAETLSDALDLFKNSDCKNAAGLLSMMDARVAALVYLIQFGRTGFKPDNYEEIVSEAALFDTE